MGKFVMAWHHGMVFKAECTGFLYNFSAVGAAEVSPWSGLKATEDRTSVKRLKMAEDETVNIYIHVINPRIISNKVVSVIYKLVIDPTCTNIQKPSANLPEIKPVFTFTIRDEIYPIGMSFVTIGSKLYFMGGSILYSEHLLNLNFRDDNIDYEDDKLYCYPPDVYVFDCIKSCLLDSSSPDWVPPMISGKPENPITFVVDNQIFVLSSQDGPQGMTHFETFDFISKKWKTLSLPHPHFFPSQSIIAKGSVLFGRKLFVGYFDKSLYTTPYYLLWYDIDCDSWTHHMSFHLPNIATDSLFPNGSLYSLVDNYIISLNGDVAATLSIDTEDMPDYDKYHTFDPFTMDNWPVHVNTYGYSTTRLCHIPGLLNGTNNKSVCLGFVEFFSPIPPDYNDEPMPPCELRFVVLEAIEGKSYKVIHASQFSSCLETSSYVSAAAASVY